MLIKALQQGVQQAFNQLVEAYQHMVFNVALGIVQQQQEAEDIAEFQSPFRINMKMN